MPVNETEYGQVGITRTIMLKLVRWLNTSFWQCWKRAEFSETNSLTSTSRDDWTATVCEGEKAAICPSAFQEGFSSVVSVLKQQAFSRGWTTWTFKVPILSSKFISLQLFFSFDIWHWRQETTQVSEEADMWQSEVAVSLRDELQQQQQWTFEHLVHVVNFPRSCESTY